MQRICPICKAPLIRDGKPENACVMHTSEKTCPKKYLIKWIHNSCAKENNIGVPG